MDELTPLREHTRKHTRPLPTPTLLRKEAQGIFETEIRPQIDKFMHAAKKVSELDSYNAVLHKKIIAECQNELIILNHMSGSHLGFLRAADTIRG